VPRIGKADRRFGGHDFFELFHVACIENCVEVFAEVIPEATGLDDTDTGECLTFCKQGNDVLARGAKQLHRFGG